MAGDDGGKDDVSEYKNRAISHQQNLWTEADATTKIKGFADEMVELEEKNKLTNGKLRTLVDDMKEQEKARDAARRWLGTAGQHSYMHHDSDTVRLRIVHMMYSKQLKHLSDLIKDKGHGHAEVIAQKAICDPYPGKIKQQTLKQQEAQARHERVCALEKIRAPSKEEEDLVKEAELTSEIHHCGQEAILYSNISSMESEITITYEEWLDKMRVAEEKRFHLRRVLGTVGDHPYMHFDSDNVFLELCQMEIDKMTETLQNSVPGGQEATRAQEELAVWERSEINTRDKQRNESTRHKARYTASQPASHNKEKGRVEVESTDDDDDQALDFSVVFTFIVPYGRETSADKVVSDVGNAINSISHNDRSVRDIAGGRQVLLSVSINPENDWTVEEDTGPKATEDMKERFPGKSFVGVKVQSKSWKDDVEGRRYFNSKRDAVWEWGPQGREFMKRVVQALDKRFPNIQLPATTNFHVRIGCGRSGFDVATMVNVAAMYYVSEPWLRELLHPVRRFTNPDCREYRSRTRAAGEKNLFDDDRYRAKGARKTHYDDNINAALNGLYACKYPRDVADFVHVRVWGPLGSDPRLRDDMSRWPDGMAVNMKSLVDVEGDAPSRPRKHFEFRAWEGTMNAEDMVAWIELCMAMVGKAFQTKRTDMKKWLEDQAKIYKKYGSKGVLKGANLERVPDADFLTAFWKFLGLKTAAWNDDRRTWLDDRRDWAAERTQAWEDLPSLTSMMPDSEEIVDFDGYSILYIHRCELNGYTRLWVPGEYQLIMDKVRLEGKHYDTHYEVQDDQLRNPSRQRPYIPNRQKEGTTHEQRRRWLHKDWTVSNSAAFKTRYPILVRRATRERPGDDRYDIFDELVVLLKKCNWSQQQALADYQSKPEPKPGRNKATTAQDQIEHHRARMKRQREEELLEIDEGDRSQRSYPSSRARRR